MRAGTGFFITAICFLCVATAVNADAFEQARQVQGDSSSGPEMTVDELLARSENLRDSRPLEAARLAERALDLLGSENSNTPDYLRALVLAARNRTRLGNYGRAMEMGMRADRIANSIEVSPGLRAEMHDALGLTYQRLGSMGDALLEFRKAHDIRAEEGDSAALVSSLTNIAGVHALSGQFVESLEHYAAALDTARALELDVVAARIRTNMAYSHIERGAPEQAQPLLEDVLAFAEAAPNPLFLAHGNQNMGEALFYLGRLDAAEQHLSRARRFAKENGLLSVLSDSEIFLGRIRLARGDPDGALDMARQAMETTQRLEEPQRLEDIHKLIYGAHKAQENTAQALQHLEESIQYRESVFNRESDRRLSLLNAQFGLTEKQHEIDLLQQEREIQSLQLDRQRQERNLVLAILMASGFVIVGLGLGLWSKIQSNRQIGHKSAQLESARQQLAQASAAKSEILATTSHEIKTPLNGILGMTDLLLASDLAPAQKQQLEAIRESGQAMTALLEDILDMSKIEAGRIEIRPADIDLHAFLQRQTAVWRSLAAGKGLGCDLVTAPDLPRDVHLDTNRLRQILLNLVSNAVKYTVEGHVRIHAALNRADGDLYHLQFTVSDTGPGLPAEGREHIFQPYQGSQGLAGSAGLGLHICRKLADALGGEIGVESIKGEGSRFWFTVIAPAASEGVLPLESSAREESQASMKLDAAAALAGRHVLIVDDNEINRRLFAAILKSAGMTWDSVECGSAAIDSAATGGYDMILMDLRMPGMDGVAATRLIRAQTDGSAGVPILAVTADAGDEEASAALSAGMDGVIAKPVKPDLLLAKISEILGRKEAGAAPAAATRS